MEKTTVAQSIIAGPINDTGQLALALVINALAGEDGWTVHTRKDLAKACRATPKTTRKWVAEMVEQGHLEERKKPVPGLRLTAKALSLEGKGLPLKGKELPLEGKFLPPGEEGKDYPPKGSDYPSGGSNFPPPSPSAYLPLKDINTKDKDIEIRGDARGETEPDTSTPNQPAAQPPAVVGQAELLPVPAKPKRKSRAKPKTPIPQDYYPNEQTINAVMALGFTAEEALAEHPQFMLHWLESGKTGNTWGSAYVNWYRYKLKWRIEDEQNAKERERFTDASGKRLSEAHVTMQDAHDNVLAHADFFASLDPDKPV